MEVAETVEAAAATAAIVSTALVLFSEIVLELLTNPKVSMGCVSPRSKDTVWLFTEKKKGPFHRVFNASNADSNTQIVN